LGKAGLFFGKLFSALGGIRVYALVGKSGTGKSFRARLVADKHGIPFIIDDGLLIHENRIIAGKSAKREAQYISAIRTALFDETSHRNEVIQAIRHNRVRKILILGTSVKMIDKVTRRLAIPPVSKLIKIEDVASREDIARALESRRQDGMHVIPVPTIEIKRDYAQILSDSIKILIKKGLGLTRGNTRVIEKSVVRPHFSTTGKGDIVISETALSQMILHCFDEFDCTLRVKKIRVRKMTGKYYIRVSIEAPFNSSLGGKLHDLQTYTIESIERFTGIVIEELSLSIDQISM
jgi:hypothetical protein